MFDPLELQLHGCQLPCGCWELNLDLLQEQQVLFTTEPTLQQLIFYDVCVRSCGLMGSCVPHARTRKAHFDSLK